MFEKASKLGLRFATAMGNLTVEDLWHLPLVGVDVCLDNIAISLNKEVKDSREESFVVKKSTADVIPTLKLDIVKRVIEVKLEDAEKAAKAIDTKARKATILSALAAKQNDDLKEMSQEDLKELLDSL